MLYLSTEEHQQLCEILEMLTVNTGIEHEAHHEIAERILRLLNADFYASYNWDQNQSSFIEGIGINIPDDHLKDYESHFQTIDPISQALKGFKKAASVNQVIDQNDLMKTEFFNDFLSRDGMYWGLNLYTFRDNGVNLGDMRIWRVMDRGPFTQKEIDLLNVILPIFRLSLLKNNSEINSEITIETILKNTCLTIREAEICIQIYHGNMDEKISDILNISFHTVRSHLRNIFTKLSVSNRTELISTLIKIEKNGRT